MRAAYFECSSGISGDMCLGCLIAAGASLKNIKQELRKIPIKGYSLTEKTVRRKGISATKIDVRVIDPEANKRLASWKDILRVIQASSLEPEIKEKGLRIFKSLFVAEAVVHGEPYDRLHLHELSAVDTIIDIFGTLISLKELKIEKVFSSPVNLGTGFLSMEHGVFPVPAPAAMELFKGIPVYSSSVSHELATPTGAAILRLISSGFGSMPMMIVDKIGMGAGARDLKDSPNILRVFIGDTLDKPDKDITVIETNIDDMSPEIYEHLMDRLFGKGAIDVFLTGIIMKKGRPGIKLTLLCYEDKAHSLIDIILKETTTLGVRFYKAGRVTLKRKIKKIDTEFGKIRVKEAYLGGRVIKAEPEYEDCRKAAKKHNVPLMEVMNRVKKG